LRVVVHDQDARHSGFVARHNSPHEKISNCMVARFEPQDVARRPAVTKSTMDRLMPRYVRRGSR